MVAKLYAMTCGHLGAGMKDMIEGGEGRAHLPVPAFLIEHPKGRVLFDTGMHPQCRVDPAARLGEGTARRFAFDQFGAADDVKSRLQAIDRDPAKIDIVVNSHLHFDHAGGNELIPNATLIVQKREWQAAHNAELAAATGLRPGEVELGHTVQQVDGEHDVFGDGSVVCIPTFGHTPGHQSLKVRTAHGEAVLTGDACYFCETLRARRLPRFVHDREQMLASLDRLEALQSQGARLFFGHDPAAWADVPQAPLQAL